MKHGKSVSSSLVRYMFALIMTYFCCAATSMVTSAGMRAISSTNSRSMFLHLQSCIRLPFVWCCYSICIAIKRKSGRCIGVVQCWFATEWWQYPPCDLPCKVEKRLLEVVVALGRDLVVLEIFLPVVSHRLGLHLPVNHIHLVAAQDNRDVLTHPNMHNKRCTINSGHQNKRHVRNSKEKNYFLPADVPVPGGNILVGEPWGDVKHDDRTDHWCSTNIWPNINPW